ncbi:MAG: acyl-CoA dehydrogenase family protein [Saprospiraceae bacterium]|nr:acyl-CoA dehydrogenase family protein [Saprospiraceae bacterium]
MSEIIEKVEKDNVLKGGEFIIRESSTADTFIPEEANEEQEMMRSAIRDFADNSIFPNYTKIEKQENNIAKDLLGKAGELGILGAHIPEEYGGMAMDTNTNTFISEEIGGTASFSVAVAAHTGIGMLPIFYYGTEEQKQKYLPGLCEGSLVVSYCLTEPGSGSDALAAKTKAELTEDGEHYLINGQKMWITNAGFADVFIVFAQVDGNKFTGFLVDSDAKGVSLGAEEDKLGIKGSSTRQVFFENVKVHKSNILGKVGKGHLIAFNVLNIGRFKLGVMALGAAKRNAVHAIKYANERHQFKVPISSFGAIKHKIAEQGIKMYATEAALYRVSKLIQDKATALWKSGVSYHQSKLDSAEEYAIECAMMKVLGSETLDYVVDETVQIHGGNGFSEEYPAARAYRDARINRIFEGTNEINRLLSINMLLKRAMKGDLDIVSPAWAVQKELAAPPMRNKTAGKYGAEIDTIANLKKIFLMTAGAAAKWQQDGKVDLRKDQEIVMNVADIMMDVFTAESLMLRVQKLEEMGKETEVPTAIMKVFIADTVDRVRKSANDALCSFIDDDTLRIMLMGVKRYAKYEPVNVMKMRRKVAAYLIEANDYVL